MLSLIQMKKSTQPWWTRFCRQLTSWGVMPSSCLQRPSTDLSRSRMGRVALWLCDTRNKHRADLSISIKDWMTPIIMHHRKGSQMTRMQTVIVTTSKFGEKKISVKYYKQQTLIIVHNRLMLIRSLLSIFHSREDWLRLHVLLREWLASYSAFLNINRSGVRTVQTWLRTSHNHAPNDFMLSHMKVKNEHLSVDPTHWEIGAG